MGNVGSLEHHRLRSKLVQIGRMNFPAPIASDRVRSLLVRQKEDQIRFSLRGGHRLTNWRAICLLWVISKNICTDLGGEFGVHGDVHAFNAATCRRIYLAPEALFHF